MSKNRMLSCVFCDVKEISGVTLHRFPNPRSQPKICAVWLKLISPRPISPTWAYKNLRVCNLHFNDNEICIRRGILKDAIPTKYLDGKIPQRKIKNNLLSKESCVSPLKESFENIEYLDLEDNDENKKEDFENIEYLEIDYEKVEPFENIEYLDSEDDNTKLKVEENYENIEYIDEDIYDSFDSQSEVTQNIDFAWKEITNRCRTCLNNNLSEYVHLEHEVCLEKQNNCSQPTKLIEMLVALGCIKELGDENWPQNVCKECVTKITTAYEFQITCLKSTTELLIHLSANSSENTTYINDTKETYDDYNGKALKIEIQEIHVDDSSAPIVAKIFNEQVQHIDRTLEEYMQKDNIRKKVRNKFASKISPRKYKDKIHLNNHMNKYVRSIKKMLQRRDVVYVDHTCEFCGDYYKTKVMLEEHIRISHYDCNHVFLCDICGSNNCSHNLSTHNMRRKSNIITIL